MTEDRQTTFLITFDDGDQTEYSYEDRTAVVDDSIPAWVSLGDHVLAVPTTANGREQCYLIGFVSADFCQGQGKEYYEVTLDHGHLVSNFTLDKLRKFSFFSSVHQGNGFNTCC